jgi:hypothetical protein
MGASAQQILQSDPEYLRRQLQAQEMQRINPTGSAAGALGALLGRGLSNVSQGKGFFQAPDYGLQRVSGVQGIMNSVEFDPNNPAKYYQEVGNQLRQAGFGDLAPLAFQEARKFTIEDAELGIKQARAGREAREAAQKNVDYYKKNPEQAEFRINELAEVIKTDPGNETALQEYNQIARAASEGAIEAASKEEKETVDLQKNKAQLAKYNKELKDAEKFGPAERWDAEREAAIALLKVNNINPTDDLDQKTAMLNPEIVQAQKLALRTPLGTKQQQTPSYGTNQPPPAPSPRTASPAAGAPVIDFGSLPQ